MNVMNKNFHYFLSLGLIILVLLQSCTKKEVIDPLQYKEYSYTDFSPTATIIKPENLGVSTYQPGVIGVSNDTLFVADNTPDAYSIWVYDLKKQQKVATLSTWKINAVDDKFSEPINHIHVSKGKIFVSSNSSRVDVFDAKTLAPVGTVGQGIWWGDSRFNIVHAFASIVKDSLLYVRDKEALVVFKLKDITAANYKKVPIFAKSKTLGYNYQSLPHDIKFSTDSLLVLTDRNDRKLYFVDSKKIQAGTDIDVLDASKTVTIPGIPASVETFKDSYLLNLQDGQLLRYDIESAAFLSLNERLIQGNTAKSMVRSKEKVWILANNGWIYGIDAQSKIIKEFNN